MDKDKRQRKLPPKRRPSNSSSSSSSFASSSASNQSSSTNESNDSSRSSDSSSPPSSRSGSTSSGSTLEASPARSSQSESSSGSHQRNYSPSPPYSAPFTPRPSYENGYASNYCRSTATWESLREDSGGDGQEEEQEDHGEKEKDAEESEEEEVDPVEEEEDPSKEEEEPEEEKEKPEVEDHSIKDPIQLHPSHPSDVSTSSGQSPNSTWIGPTSYSAPPCPYWTRPSFPISKTALVPPNSRTPSGIISVIPHSQSGSRSNPIASSISSCPPSHPHLHDNYLPRGICPPPSYLRSLSPPRNFIPRSTPPSFITQSPIPNVLDHMGDRTTSQYRVNTRAICDVDFQPSPALTPASSDMAISSPQEGESEKKVLFRRPTSTSFSKSLTIPSGASSRMRTCSRNFPEMPLSSPSTSMSEGRHAPDKSCSECGKSTGGRFGIDACGHYKCVACIRACFAGSLMCRACQRDKSRCSTNTSTEEALPSTAKTTEIPRNEREKRDPEKSFAIPFVPSRKCPGSYPEKAALFHVPHLRPHPRNTQGVSDGRVPLKKRREIREMQFTARRKSSPDSPRPQAVSELTRIQDEFGSRCKECSKAWKTTGDRCMPGRESCGHVKCKGCMMSMESCRQCPTKILPH